MQAVATELDCGVMSIYSHYSGKEALIQALAGQVMRDLHHQLPPAGDGPWRQELLSYFTAYREAIESLTAYREISLNAPTYILRESLTGAQLRRVESGVGLLMRAGLTLEEAARGYNALFNYTRCFVALEHAQRSLDEEGPARRDPAPADVAELPLLQQLGDVNALLRLDEDTFAYGLGLLIDGVAAVSGPAASSRRSSGAQD